MKVIFYLVWTTELKTDENSNREPDDKSCHEGEEICERMSFNSEVNHRRNLFTLQHSIGSRGV